MNNRITFGDGVRFELGFLVAQIIFVIIIFFIFMFFGSILASYSSSIINDLSDAATEFGNGVALWLLN